MLRPAPHTRYHIAAILAAHWIEFVAQYKRWIRPVVFENVPYHHLIMAIPWQLRIVIIMNRRAGLNLLVHAATEAIGQWARDIKAMRMGTLIVIHTFIGRLIRHIPDKDFPMIRYAGVFSNRWKQHYL